MGIVVQKYGGTSVADPERIKAVAEHVAFTRSHGNDVVVVVSAMGKTTDNLISLANQVSGTHPGRELDMLLTAGERISMAVLAMAINDLITVGATPLVVQAYWAAGGSDWFADAPRAQALVAGWKRACDLCQVAWGGGETPAGSGHRRPGSGGGKH